jgi:hypothetical protein
MKHEGAFFKIKIKTPKMGEYVRGLEASVSNSKIYLDTNILSRSDYRVSAPNAEALRRIAAAHGSSLFTSAKSRREIELNKNEAKRSFDGFIYELIAKIPEANTSDFVGGLGTAPLGTRPLGGGVSTPDPLYEKLCEIFDRDDAEHIYQAVKGGSAFFLTLDTETILSRRAAYNALGLRTKIVSPQELEKILFALEDNTG